MARTKRTRTRATRARKLPRKTARKTARRVGRRRY